jgi:MFS family permease
MATKEVHSIDWARRPAIPRGVAAALAALRFDAPNGCFGNLEESEWQQALSFCDRSRLTLLLGWNSNGSLPESIRARISRNLARNSQKLERLKSAFMEIARTLEEDSIEYVALRGLTHLTEYVPEARLRCQGDIDLLFAGRSAARAVETMGRLGYRPMEALAELPTDHLPAMIRNSDWEWKGDHYDPDAPISVDLHFRLWDQETERFPAPGTEQFWDRRSCQIFEGTRILCLHPADRLGSAALHLLRHLLRSSLVPSQVYEIAWFLHSRTADDAFWNEWSALHAPELRRLEAIVFRLAAEWFGCGLPSAATQEIANLPEAVQLWFARYSASPMQAFFHPNKNELWLHFALIASARDRRAIFFRRVIPAKLPTGRTAALDDQPAKRLRMRRRAHDRAHAFARALFHARSLPSVAWEGARWWLKTCGISPPFWNFLATGALFDFGISIFVLLYNIYLLDLGYREDFLGTVVGAMTAGNIAGTLPAGLLARRIGIRRCLVACVAAAAIVSGTRTLAVAGGLVIALAFLNGVILAVWAVSYVPAVAQSAGPRNQPLAYSLSTVEGVGMGIVAGLAGGWMPKFLVGAGLAATRIAATRAVMLVACGAALLAVLPASRLRLAALSPRERTTYPRGPFIGRFLIAMGVWSLATGSFSPFFNAYFSHHLRLPLERVGLIYAFGQVVQVLMVLAAPLVLRRIGLIGGITAMQFATGIALMLLASSSVPAAAAIFYIGYIGFRWMSEPGLFTLLMKEVAPEQQSGASALNFLVTFTTNAIAAAAAGFALVRFGYPAVLAIAGVGAVSAALLFRGLLSRNSRTTDSPGAAKSAESLIR